MQEKAIKPRFAARVNEAYISQLTKADFAGYALKTVGGIYARYLLEHGFELNLARDMIRPRSDFESLRFRFGQIHDYEHIIAGGGLTRWARSCLFLGPVLDASASVA